MRKKVKGFTLIELIVVLAIFSIVMVAATSLMQPVSKIMVTTDVNDTGNNNVSQISKYLELSLAPAEYLDLAHFVPTEDQRKSMVKCFVDKYYSGILKKDATVSNPLYAEATIHVMVIDNVHSGKISEYVYKCDLEPGKDPVEQTSLSKEYAVNKVLYDNYAYTIYPGVSKYTAESGFTVASFMKSAGNPYNTSFTIDAETTRYKGRPNQRTLTFTGTATVVLSNINAGSSLSGVPGSTNSFRENGVPKSTYFVIDNGAIVDKCKVAPISGTGPEGVDYTGIYNDATYGSIYGNTASSVDQVKNGGLCFVYAYGPEIVTGPKT